MLAHAFALNWNDPMPQSDSGLILGKMLVTIMRHQEIFEWMPPPVKIA
jgi:hypothetical protein